MTAHNGHIWVRSTGVPGEGCVFGMELAISALLLPNTSQTDINNFDMPGSQNTTLDANDLVHNDIFCGLTHSMHTLIVDDAPTNRKMLMRHLTRLGITHVSQACNGLEAVQAVQERLQDDCDKPMFDIIFMDCNMPVMGGNEATTKIRELGYEGTILSVTGNGMSEDVREILACGANEVLVKPVRAEALASVLQGSSLSTVVSSIVY
jgi:CheY-like chemotaxis protein